MGIVATKRDSTVIQADMISEFQYAWDLVDTDGKPELALRAPWFCSTRHLGHSKRVKAGAHVFSTIRMPEQATVKPGLLPNDAKFAQDTVLQVSSRIKPLAEDLAYHNREA